MRVCITKIIFEGECAHAPPLLKGPIYKICFKYKRIENRKVKCVQRGGGGGGLVDLLIN